MACSGVWRGRAWGGRRREETEMPKNDRERTRKARTLMQQRPELNYTRALAEVDATPLLGSLPARPRVR